jgi:hypothetical protein
MVAGSAAYDDLDDDDWAGVLGALTLALLLSF